MLLSFTEANYKTVHLRNMGNTKSSKYKYVESRPSAQNQRSTWNQAILIRSLSGYLPSFRQSLAHWAPTQATKISPTQLQYYLFLKSYLHNWHFQVKVEDSYTDLLPVKAEVPQGSVRGPLLYLLYTADLPTSPDATIATFADDTAILATDPDPAIASHKLQTSFLAIQHWLTKWRLKANSSKSIHVTFTTRRAACPGVHIYNEQLPQAEEVKYLGLHLDRRLTWHKHVFAKRKHLGIILSKMYWLLGLSSNSISNKLLAHKVILKTIWTYGMQLWGSASISNIEILERL
jgi:hypothetical protein